MDDLHRFGPELSLLIAAGLIVVNDAVFPMPASKRAQRTAIAAVLALLGIAVSAGWSLLLLLNDDRGEAFDGLMVVDDYSLFFNFLFAGVAAMIVLASIDFMEKIRFPAEYIALVLAATVGMMLMASSVDLIAIFVALELQAIAFYILVGFMKDRRFERGGS